MLFPREKNNVENVADIPFPREMQRVLRLGEQQTWAGTPQEQRCALNSPEQWVRWIPLLAGLSPPSPGAVAPAGPSPLSPGAASPPGRAPESRGRFPAGLSRSLAHGPAAPPRGEGERPLPARFRLQRWFKTPPPGRLQPAPPPFLGHGGCSALSVLVPVPAAAAP